MTENIILRFACHADPACYPPFCLSF